MQATLAQLRRRAEAALEHPADKPRIVFRKNDEVIHELNVYHVELEIQLEDLQQSYRELEAAKQRYASLFDFAPIGYIVTDMHGIVTTANRTASTMLGVSHDVLERRSFAESLVTDFQDIYHLHLRAIQHTRQATMCEVQLQRADGTILYAQLNSDLPDIHSETVRTAIVDISAIKQADEALRRVLAHEKEINILQNHVLSVIAHEFRTPLTILLTNVDIVDRYGDRLTDEKKQQRYETIRNLLWYLNDTVQDARTIQELDDSPRLRIESFDVIAFIRQIINDMSTLPSGNQEIVLEIIAQRENETITGDRHLVRRIVMNVLKNALNYSNEKVCLQLECEDTLIRLQISDRGIGISEEDQQRMYEAFYRSDNVNATSGTGIGLFVVQRAVQALGGTIRCESRLGEGTTFIIELPRQDMFPPE